MAMKLNANLSDLFFARLDNIVLDMFTGGMGFTADGNVYTFSDGTVVSNPLTDTAMTIPGFAMRVDRSALKVGDIVVQRPGKSAAGSLAFVVEVPSETNKDVMLANASGVKFALGATRNVLFGGNNTVMAISSPLSDAFSAGNAGGMNPLMLMALMDDKEGGKGGDFMKFALMSQMMGGNTGAAGGMNPLLMMALLDK